MPKIKLIWLLSSTYVLGILIFALGLSLGVRRLPDTGQPQSDTFVWIYQHHDVVQSLQPLNDGLNIITVYMKNVGLRNRKPLTFTLQDINQHPVREINLNGYNVGDGDSVRFQFNPVTDSGGKTYRLVLSSPDSVLSDAIGVGSSQGSISYQAYYFPSGRLAVIRGVVSSFITTVIRPEFLILFVFLGLVSLGFGLFFEYNNLA